MTGNTKPASNPASPDVCDREPALLDAAVVLALLHASGPLNFEQLAVQCRRPIEHIRDQIALLADADCTLEVHPSAGVTLHRTSLGIWCSCLREIVARPRPLGACSSTESTQDQARRWIEMQGLAADGGVFMADEQTAGRGRLGRRWLAPPGSCVLVSRAVVAKSGEKLSPERLALASAVAVAVAIDRVAQGRCAPAMIKWPNDVVVDRRKIAGILVESLPGERAAVIGIGVNVSFAEADLPMELRGRATSLAMLGVRRDRLTVLIELLKQWDACLDPAADLGGVLQAWRNRNVFAADETLAFAHDGRTYRGKIVDLDAHEGLILRTDSGEIVHLPAASTSVVV